MRKIFTMVRYHNLTEDEKAKWLEEKGYKAKTFKSKQPNPIMWFGLGC